MATFKYKGMDAQGTESSGQIEADSRARAIALIKERGMFPTSVAELNGRKPRSVAGPGRAASASTGGKGLDMEIKLPGFLSDLIGGRVKGKHLSVFTRQLAIALDAGLPLLRGLKTLHKQEKHPTLRNALTGMGEAVESGTTFSEALAQFPKVFDSLYINMVKAGEAGGILDTILSRLAEFMEKAERIRNRVRSAMVYPIVVLVLSVVILGFLLTFIIPRFEDVFDDLLEGAPLPPLTMFVINLSEIVQTQFLLVIGVVAVLVVALKIFSKTSFGSLTLDRIKLRMPVFGMLFRKASIARFSRTLGTLLASGVPILQALNIVRETAGNEVISRAIMRVHDSVKEGDTMADPLAASKAFPDMVVSMIDVGEETGALPDMLVKIADAYDDEVDRLVESLTSVIEPIMIVFLAVIVGTIVIAMFLPLVTVIEKLS
jgi:type IV pilus assembly protein PilC